MNTFGISQRHLDSIRSALSRCSEVKKVLVFGSRAMGNFKKGSDVDLALFGPLSPSMVAKMSRLLNEESLLPYKFDLVHYESISEPKLKEHIDRVGKILF